MKIQNILLKGVYDKPTGRYIYSYSCSVCGAKKTAKLGRKTYLGTGKCKKCIATEQSYNSEQSGKPLHFKGKPVSFRFYNREEVEHAESIRAFCRKHPELGENASYHFSGVINGKRLHYKGWLLGSNKVKLEESKVKTIEMTLVNRAIINLDYFKK